MAARICRGLRTMDSGSERAGLSQDEEIAQKPTEWNDAYYGLLVKCLPGLQSQEIDEISLTPITSLPDETFLMLLRIFFAVST
jgi:hypothetical protein